MPKITLNEREMIMDGPIPFPEDVLLEIGRVVVAATKLEFMLAEFAASILRRLLPTIL